MVSSTTVWSSVTSTFSGDGKIDFPEFAAMMADKLESKDSETEIQDAFKIFDKDGNGFISSLEMREIIMGFDDTLTETEVDEMIQEVDLDGDGQLNYEGNSFVTTETLFQTLFIGQSSRP